MAYFCAVVLALLSVEMGVVKCAPVLKSRGTRTRPLSTDEVVSFLVNFGYLAVKSSTKASNSSAGGKMSNSNSTGSTLNQVKPEMQRTNPYTSGETTQAIIDFQAFTNLKQTGTVTSETSAAMTSPRCGVRDKYPRASISRPNARRFRRFVVEGSKWPQTTVTYCISQPSSQLTLNEQKLLFEAAFRKWAEICPLVFRYTDNQQSSNINIRFASGSHGDGKAFDGNGGVLAHAFFPISGGDIHLDEDEIWDKMLNGVTTHPDKESLLKVAIHEIGHSIGLRHTSVKSAVMNAYYASSQNIAFSADDVYGAQSLYGQCETSLDTVFSWMGNRRTYFMKSGNSWRFDDIRSEIEPGYPKPVRTQWLGVPDDIDEAFLWSQNWVTYFFKGSWYYRYNDQMDKVESGYPKPIKTGWPGVPDNIDAAFTLSVDISYFLKGNLCYMFDNKKDEIFAGYPKKIAECFPGIPDNIDTAVRYIWDNVIYFFKGINYYQYDRDTKTAVGPLSTKHKWRNLCFV